MTVGHAGETETSVIHVLAPDAVRRNRMQMVPGITDDPTPSATR